MAETPRAGMGDFACRSWRCRCLIVLMRQGNLSMGGTFFIRLLPPLIIVDNSFNMQNTGFFSDSYLLSVTNGSIWIPYLATYSKIFKKPNFQVIKWKSTFIWKTLSQAEMEHEGSRLAIIFGLPPTPHLGAHTRMPCVCVRARMRACVCVRACVWVSASFPLIYNMFPRFRQATRPLSQRRCRAVKSTGATPSELWIACASERGLGDYAHVRDVVLARASTTFAVQALFV